MTKSVCLCIPNKNKMLRLRCHSLLLNSEKCLLQCSYSTVDVKSSKYSHIHQPHQAYFFCSKGILKQQTNTMKKVRLFIYLGVYIPGNEMRWSH